MTRMPFCSHCSRNVSKKTELLHRKHGTRPRLTVDAVAAFRKSGKASIVRNVRKRARTQGLRPSPELDLDVQMNGDDPSSRPADHHFAIDTAAQILDVSRDEIFEAAMGDAQMRVWPDGTCRYAARVDDYESDEENGEESGDDHSRGKDESIFDDTDSSIDVAEYANGLSAWDELGEEFEREAVENGKFSDSSFVSVLIGTQVITSVPQIWPFSGRLH
jgi:hypothetical protein